MRKPNRGRPVQPEVHLTANECQLGINRIAAVLQRVQKFDPGSVTEQSNIPHVDALSAAVDDALIRTFGADTHDYRRYSDAAFFDNGPFNYVYEVPISAVHESLRRSKGRSEALLSEAITSLEERRGEYRPDDGRSAALKTTESPSRKVFLVHGRDEAARNEVALFLTAIGLEPIVLRQRPNGGRHLLTKFTEEAEGASFAVVLMTPDDEGGSSGAGALQLRARQNVVFELGFFIGRLGPAKVAALLKGNVEKPSDFDGIAYIDFDSNGRWKTDLARELHHASVPFDPARAFTA